MNVDYFLWLILSLNIPNHHTSIAIGACKVSSIPKPTNRGYNLVCKITQQYVRCIKYMCTMCKKQTYYSLLIYIQYQNCTYYILVLVHVSTQCTHMVLSGVIVEPLMIVLFVLTSGSNFIVRQVVQHTQAIGKCNQDLQCHV